MATAKSFDQFISSDLASLLVPLEQERKKVVRTAYISYIPGGIGLILFLVSSSSGQMAFAISGFVLLGIAIIVFFVFRNHKADYVSSFKEKIVRSIIRFIDPDLDYKPGLCINEDDYTNSGLFLKRADKYWGDDYVMGKRGKTAFCFSELHTQHREGSGKNEHWETIFQGLFFIADFNKNFSGRTYVWSEQDPQLNFLTRMFSGLEKVKLESPDFEKTFIVYSTDQVESRYILTPSCMERMVKLDKMLGSRGISFSFVNTNIHVAIPGEELFEPSIFSPNNSWHLGYYYQTVQLVFEIIDELKLNDRLWTKE